MPLVYVHADNFAINDDQRKEEEERRAASLVARSPVVARGPARNGRKKRASERETQSKERTYVCGFLDPAEKTSRP